MFKYVAFIITLILFSCVTGKGIEGTLDSQGDQSPSDTLEVTLMPDYLVKATIGDYQESDPIYINSAEIKGNTLTLEVSYSGGCTEHSFEFIGSPVVMKSQPPKRTVKLVHHSQDDTCEEHISQQIVIDLKDIAYSQESGSEIILLLSGYKGELHFIYE